MKAIKDLPVMKSLPPGIQVTEAGDAELQAELFDGFGSAMRNGLMMVYVVLAVLFGSLLQPLTILVSLPLALGGAIVGLLATNKPISAPVVIGILMLMGIVTKNAIMLVDFAIEAMRRGVERTTAIIEAGRMRARPIVMTTIAMAAGMAPSALAIGAGGEFRSPMAIAVIGGLTASTLLSLLFVPTLFTLVDDVGRITGRIFGRLIGPTGETPTPPVPVSPGGLPMAEAPRLVPQLTPQGTPPRISAEPSPEDDRILICANADNAIRWTEGERLNDLFERRCDELADAEAVVTDAATYSFRDLDDRANQVARYLLSQGLKPGDRIGLVFDKTFDTYVALLAVLKLHAAYVPLDAGFPNDRISFICGDAEVKAILSLSIFSAKLDVLEVPKIFLDTVTAEIDAQPKTRLTDAERAPSSDQLAYLIYTSGTTGTPKGVAIEHASICNFVRVAAEVYGMKPGDRCYQGMTIAFDFSVEELWVPLLAGATLVPGKPGTSLVGSDLADYLAAKHVTVMCCVPTLLGTIERDLPDLRILLVSGEACPQNLVTRWQRPGRIMLNAYGPTEATVTCTLTELYPNKPVTIGGPLPTYSIVILAEDKDEALARGAMGEIARRRHRARRRLSQPPGPDGKEVHPGLPAHRQQPVRAHLPHRRPRPHQRQQRGRIPRPHRHPGQGPRLSHRTGGDRVGPGADAAHFAGRGECLRARAGRGRTRRLLRAQAGDGGPAAQRGRREAAQAAAALHGAGLSRAPRHHPDDDQPQGRPQEPAGAQGAAHGGRQRQFRRRQDADRGRAGARPRRRHEARPRVGHRQLLPGSRRAFAADGALRLGDPQADAHFGGIDARHLSQPDGREARRASRYAAGRSADADEPGADPGAVGVRVLHLRLLPASVLCRLRHVRALAVCARAGMGLRRHRRLGLLLRPLGDLRVRVVRDPDRDPDPRQMAAGRALDRRHVPDLGPALFPLLAGAQPDPGEPDGAVRRQPASTICIYACSACGSAATASSPRRWCRSAPT